jgi:hypothetical protein
MAADIDMLRRRFIEAAQSGDEAKARRLMAEYEKALDAENASGGKKDEPRAEPGKFSGRIEREPLTGTDYLKGLGRTALQGLTFNFGDELLARMRQPFSDKSYDKLRQEERDAVAQFAEENPMTAIGSEIVGGALPSVAAMFVPGGQAAGAAGAANVARNVGALTRLARTAKRPTAVGAGSGALTGVGTSEEMEDAAGEAGRGALVGGAVGAGMQYALPAAARGYTNLADRFNLPGADAVGRARDYVMKQVNDAGMSIDDLRRRLAEDERLGVPLGLQYQSPELERAANVAVMKSPTGARLAEDIRGQQSGMMSRTMDKLNTALKPDDFFDETDKVVERLRTRAAPYYDRAYAAAKGIQETPELTTLLNRPGARAIWEEALDAPMFTLTGKTPGKMVWNNGQRVMVEPSLETMDQFKRVLDRKISKLENEGHPTDPSKPHPDLSWLIGYRKDYMKALEDALPRDAKQAWQEARAIYRDDAQVRDLLNFGRDKFLNLTPQEFSRRIAQSANNPLELEAIRTGAYEAIRKRMGAATETLAADSADATRNWSKALIEKPEMREKLRMLVGDDDAADLMLAALRREAEIFSSSNKIVAGSPTAPRNEAVKEFEGQPSGMENIMHAAAAAGNAATGNAPGVTRNLFTLAKNIYNTAPMPEERAKEVARLFGGATQQEIDAVLRTLEAHSLQRGAQFQTARRALPAAPVAPATAATGRFPELPEQEQEQPPPIPPGP